MGDKCRPQDYGHLRRHYVDFRRQCVDSRRHCFRQSSQISGNTHEIPEHNFNLCVECYSLCQGALKHENKL